jgi:hypothetical protein
MQCGGSAMFNALKEVWTEINAAPATLYEVVLLFICLAVVVSRMDKLARRVSALEKQAKDQKPPPG